MTFGQQITIKNGHYAGKTAWFWKYSRKEGYCFVQFPGPGHRGGHVKIEDVE